MRKLKWLLVMAIGWFGLMGYLMFSNQPRMITQEHIRTYDAHMPLMPAGTVTVEKPAPIASVLATAGNVKRGKVYYGYYCIQCHGELGDGNGPVGESFLPKPADLRGAQMQSYSDKELLNAITEGAGHSPVLEYTVRPEHRPYLLVYVKSLRKP